MTKYLYILEVIGVVETCRRLCQYKIVRVILFFNFQLRVCTSTLMTSIIFGQEDFFQNADDLVETKA